MKVTAECRRMPPEHRNDLTHRYEILVSDLSTNRFVTAYVTEPGSTPVEDVARVVTRTALAAAKKLGGAI